MDLRLESLEKQFVSRMFEFHPGLERYEDGTCGQGAVPSDSFSPYFLLEPGDADTAP